MNGLSPDIEERLKKLVNVFLAENANINLSAFRTEETCWVGNVLDSVAALDVLTASIPQPLPPAPTSIPQPLPPEEEGGLPRARSCRPRNMLFFAREMRNNPTETEALLWERIRNDNLGVRFQRQFMQAGAIFDFYCPECHLAVEVDGGIHQSASQKKYDNERDAYFLEEHGITTLRFSNDQILNNLDDVLTSIKIHVQKHSPSPRERGLGGEVLDLGTGGGFPLLPLAICLPDCHFTGVDSVQKKISAIERIAKALQLQNISLLCGRAEELGRDPAHREQYDIVTCRAVAEINVLIEYAAPLLKVGGKLLLWKSLTIDQELKDSLLARAELSCHLQNSYHYELPGDWGKRQILIFQKAAKTSSKYPRGVGVPKSEPLR